MSKTLTCSCGIVLVLLGSACSQPGTHNATVAGTSTTDDTPDTDADPTTGATTGGSASSASSTTALGSTSEPEATTSATASGSTEPPIESSTSSGTDTDASPTDGTTHDVDTCQWVQCEMDSSCIDGLKCQVFGIHTACADENGPVCCEPIDCGGDEDCKPGDVCSGGGLCVDEQGTTMCSASAQRYT
jgi:hypothetical protein